MDANNGILCPVPEDERTPFVDVLLKFIDWQKVRIDHAEEENDRLKKEIAELKKKQLVEKREKKESIALPHKKITKTPKRKQILAPLKIQKQEAVKPENVQQLLVKNIQQLLVNIGSKNKRQFTRLHIHLDAELNFGSQFYYKRAVENISLGGLYVVGNFHQQLGDICTVTLNHSELDDALEIHATCFVVRSDEQGLGLEFISMKLDDFCHLQTILLYQADDPVVLGTEFVNNANLELEEDLIICNAFHFRGDKENEPESSPC
ncbi:MAG: PilZ domain-containing protein [Candidatus Electrothrix sp. EH2]|nr:PilZ domain-containing protein [Candidatus Electrothrix sp. EH2]